MNSSRPFRFAATLTASVALSALGCTAEVGSQTDDLQSSRSYDFDAVGEALSEADREAIVARFGEAPFAASEVVDASMVLHDTAGSTSTGYMRGEAEEARGPLGLGPAVYIDAAGRPFIGRPFFDRFRPSSTLHERAQDHLDQRVLTEQARILWDGLDDNVRQDALSEVLSPVLESTPGEAHRLSLAETEDQLERAEGQLSGLGSRLYTTALWTFELLLRDEAAEGLLGAEATIELQRYFEARNRRVASSVNIEIGQIAGNGCRAGAPLRAYDDASYETLAQLYLHSAMMAGYYPRLDTHFSVDAAFSGHCDPRCLDVDRLYDTIAEVVGHEGATLYGVLPNYGMVWGRHNVWWHEATCGGPPPSQAQ